MTIAHSSEENTTSNQASTSQRLTNARLSSDELDVLEKMGEDTVTVNLDITLRPVTWLALQKYAIKHDCSLSKSLEHGLEESESVGDCINIRQAKR